MNEITHQRAAERLKSQYGDAVQQAKDDYGALIFYASKDKIISLLQFLRDDTELQFTFLTSLCGVHYPDRKDNFEVVYHLHSFVNNIRLRIKVPLSGDSPHIDTATTVFKCANWLERETYDFFGIIFDGHPNLKRILNVDEMTIFPMRKEYPLEDNVRKDKDDQMFGRGLTDRIQN